MGIVLAQDRRRRGVISSHIRPPHDGSAVHCVRSLGITKCRALSEGNEVTPACVHCPAQGTSLFGTLKLDLCIVVLACTCRAPLFREHVVSALYRALLCPVKCSRAVTSIRNTDICVRNQLAGRMPCMQQSFELEMVSRYAHQTQPVQVASWLGRSEQHHTCPSIQSYNCGLDVVSILFLFALTCTRHYSIVQRWRPIQLRVGCRSWTSNSTWMSIGWIQRTPKTCRSYPMI